MKKLPIILIIFSLFFILCSCDKDEPVEPVVPNDNITNNDNTTDNKTPEVEKYKITFYIDSEETKTIEYEKNSKITLENIKQVVFNNSTPTKYGYLIENWYSDDQYKNVINFPYEVTANTNLYLNWKFDNENYCKLTYYLDDEIYEQKILEKNSEYKAITNPTKNGYYFDGWYTNKFKLQKYTFNSNKIILDINLYGYLNQNIIEDSNNNTSVETVELCELLYCIDGTKIYYKDNILKGNLPIKISDPIKEGYIFEGWYTDYNCTEKFNYNEPIELNTTLFAKFIEKTNLIYKVNYILDGFLFNTLILQENESLDSIDLGLLEYEGYVFEGWYTDSTYTTLCTEITNINADINLYARYVKLNEYKVEFYFNNELVETKNVYDGFIVEAARIETEKDYICDNWYTTSDFTEIFDFTKPITEDLKLYSRLTDFDLSVATIEEKINLSAGGYVYDKLPDFNEYKDTTAYRKVSTADELILALKDAKYTYTTIFYYDGRNDKEKEIATRLAELDYINRTSSLTSAQKTERTSLENQALSLGIPGHIEQELVSAGTVHVIEIMNDINLGYYVLSQTAKSSGVVKDYSSGKEANFTKFIMSDMFTENGISEIQISNTTNLLIYSKNGAKLTHAGFQILSSHNIVIRNIEFDEIWQWEDASTTSTGYVGDYDAFGWAYFKISFSGYVWIDHCTFGKSYDGQIDYSNPIYNVKSTSFRAPYGTDGVSNGLHISWCNFNGGSDDPNGYLYKMMKKIDDAYENKTSSYLYYNKLRDSGFTFEEILYSLAIPQKKGFLLGDNGSEDQKYNYAINVSFANCKFINIEDRLPKLRGGNCYMYNCLVDCSQYFKYREILRNADAKNIITAYVSTWKCALVSQGLVISQDGSVKAEGCIFRGIDALLKNNDAGFGGYELVNCSYEKLYYNTDGSIDETKSVRYTGSSSDKNNLFNTTGAIDTIYFKWNTKDNLEPFNADEVPVDYLEKFLDNKNYYSGTNTNLADYYLDFYY